MTGKIALACAMAGGTTALLLLALLRRAPAWGLIDRPNLRSSHRTPRPRGGGVAVAVGLLAALATLTALGGRFPVRAAVVLGAALVLAAVGFWDDLARLSPRLRLAMQFGVAAAMVAALGGLPNLPLPPPADLALPRVAGAALAVLWLVAATNFFNFMDGIDGLAGGQGLLSALALAWLGAGSERAGFAWSLAAALSVFLIFNWAPARLFLGDSGSVFLGFLLAAWPWLGPADERAPTLFLVATSLALFLLDPLWTLAARWRRGARLTEAHREHMYQRLAARAGGHAPVATGLLAAAALLTALALWSFGDARRGWWVCAAAVALFVLELALSPRRRMR